VVRPQAMALCNLIHHSARPQALRNDLCLDLVRPVRVNLTPTLFGRENLQCSLHGETPVARPWKGDHRLRQRGKRGLEQRLRLTFSRGKIVSDEHNAPGVEIARPSDKFRRIRIESPFGRMTILITDCHLPFPYGHALTGYEVSNLKQTLEKAKSSGAKLLVPPFRSEDREAAMVEFPGGYVVEVHQLTKS
jgi:hypothetical protein